MKKQLSPVLTSQLPTVSANRYWRVVDAGLDHWGHFNTDCNDYKITLMQRGRVLDRALDRIYVEPSTDLTELVKDLAEAAQQILARVDAQEARTANMRTLLGV